MRKIEQIYQTAHENVKVAIRSGSAENVMKAIEQGINNLHDAGSPDNEQERNAILSRSAQLDQMAI